MPGELTVKLRTYFRNTQYLLRAKRYEQLLEKMSYRLRGDSAFRMASRALKKVLAYLSD